MPHVSSPCFHRLLNVTVVAGGMLAGCADSGTQEPAAPAVQSQQSTTEAAASLPESVKLTWVTSAEDDRSTRLEVTGLSSDALSALSSGDFNTEKLRKLLKISVGSNDAPAMLGEYRVQEDRLVFEPAFELTPGLRYFARFDSAALPDADGSTQPVVTSEFSPPQEPPPPPTVVEQIYPTRDVLPENTLKFYIHFSAPMRKGEAYEHIHLIETPPLSGSGEVEYPFLELGEELWDYTGTRFTLLIDPGRIKRGLKPREEVGPSLEEGKSYTLVIDAGWTDAAGRKLKEPFEKAFRVVGPDETQPDPQKWKISQPAAGTRYPLQVTFAEPLDHAMLQRVLVVRDAAGDSPAGEIRVEQGETVWSFRPDDPWKAGEYTLEVETTLEDAAGNSIGRMFDVDVVTPIEKRVFPETVSLPFKVAGGGDESP